MAITKRGKAKVRYELAVEANSVAVNEFNRAQRRYKAALLQLGETKMRVVRGPIRTYLQRESLFVGGLPRDILDKAVANSGLEISVPDVSTREITEVVEAYGAIARGLGIGAAGSAIAGTGVPIAVTSFATASTGTAISTLSGAAATNATMAWLGGGAVASGGGGVAVGAAVLTATAAAPLLLAGGGVLWWKTRAATKARLDEASAVEADTAKYALPISQMHRLVEVANHLNELLERFLPLMRNANRELTKIADRESDYRRMTIEDQIALGAICTLVHVGAAAVECELATKKGNLKRAARIRIASLEKVISNPID